LKTVLIQNEQSYKHNSYLKESKYMNKRIINFITTLLMCCFSSLVNAEPSPFGVTIKKTTEEELKQKYSSLNYIGINNYSGGKMYEVNPSQVEFDGVKSLRFIFSIDDKVLAVVADIEKNKHYKLFDMLSSKYKLIFNDEPFVGDKAAAFIDDNTKIYLATPHLGFYLQLRYIHKDLNTIIGQKSAEEKKQKKDQELGKL
jgi:hypothetical protein